MSPEMREIFDIQFTGKTRKENRRKINYSMTTLQEYLEKKYPTQSIDEYDDFGGNFFHERSIQSSHL